MCEVIIFESIGILPGRQAKKNDNLTLNQPFSIFNVNISDDKVMKLYNCLLSPIQHSCRPNRSPVHIQGLYAHSGAYVTSVCVMNV